MNPRKSWLLAIALIGSAPACAQERAGMAAETIALVGGAVIDGTGAARQTGVTLLIRGERIAAIGKGLTVPEGARVIDVSGKTLIPGLIDMHGHYYGNVGGRIADLFEPYALLYLAGGVTTTFSPGDHDPEGMLAFRDRVRAGKATGPRIFAGGPYLDHAPSVVSWIAGVSGADAAAAKVKLWAPRVDAIKVYTSITDAELRAVIETAHRAKLRVVGHLGSITATRAIELGIDGLEHGIFSMSELASSKPGDYFDPAFYQRLADLDLDSPVVVKLIQAIVEHKVVIDPTIVVFQSALTELEPVTEDLERFIPAKVLASVRRRQQMTVRLTKRHGEAWPKAVRGALRTAMRFVKRVHDAGGIVVAGTDPVAIELIPGYGLHRELANFVEAGIPPLEVLTIGSRNAARALRLDAELGTLEKGKRADVVVLDGDPAKDITALNRTVLVFRDGVRYDVEALRKRAEGKIR